MASFAKIIRIASLPHGKAPESVRRGWIGCILPTAGITCGHIRTYTSPVGELKRTGLMTAKEFLARDRTDETIDGYDVYQTIALQVLECHNPKAAEWFYSCGYPSRDPYWDCFGFKLAEVETIRTYTEQELMAA